MVHMVITNGNLYVYWITIVFGYGVAELIIVVIIEDLIY